MLIARAPTSRPYCRRRPGAYASGYSGSPNRSAGRRCDDGGAEHLAMVEGHLPRPQFNLGGRVLRTSTVSSGRASTSCGSWVSRWSTVGFGRRRQTACSRGHRRRRQGDPGGHLFLALQTPIVKSWCQETKSPVPASLMKTGSRGPANPRPGSPRRRRSPPAGAKSRQRRAAPCWGNGADRFCATRSGKAVSAASNCACSRSASKTSMGGRTSR